MPVWASGTVPSWFEIGGFVASITRWWTEAVNRLGGLPDIAAQAAQDLVGRYNEDHRRYHDLRHVHAVARDAGTLAVELGLGDEDRALLTIAACAHDVVYDARPGEDERRSAHWTAVWLGRAGLDPAHIAAVERLVLATIGHGAPTGDLLATALLDADLAILGAEPTDYDDYAAAVRHEYSAVDDAAWETGRAEVLSRLLNRERLYLSDAASIRWDAVARGNLARELNRYRRGPRIDDDARRDNATSDRSRR
jgi:predicted metal-dependent HD superfamily phosphohydrolase